MFTHVFVGSNDLARSKRFYDAVFTVLGAEPGTMDESRGRVVYQHQGRMFLVATPIDGKPATAANGGTIGFAMAGPEQTDAWYAAGVAAGGSACEDPPGVRANPFGDLYLAYLRDPDGNKLCGLYAMPKV